MKKALVVILVVVTMIPLLTACGGDTLVGTWGATINGDYGEMTLNEDGTGTLTSNGSTRSCVWEAEGNVLTVEQEVDGLPYVFLDGVTYTIEGDMLTVTNPESGNTLTFEKQ